MKSTMYRYLHMISKVVQGCNQKGFCIWFHTTRYLSVICVAMVMLPDIK